MTDEHKCPHCPETRPSRARLAHHITNVHTDLHLKCPFCRETRQARLSLKNHVNKVHGHANTAEALAQAIRGVQWTTPAQDAEAATAAVVDEPKCWPPTPSEQSTPEQPRCICGDPIQLMDEDVPDWWIHSPGSNTPCLDAVPAKLTIASQGRKELSERMAETGEKLAKAGDEIKALREQAEAVAARLEALDAGVMDPITVRKATLNQVWDKLMDAGNITGAQLVMRMIGTNFEGDWS